MKTLKRKKLLLSALMLITLVVTVPFIASAISGTALDDEHGRISLRVNNAPIDVININLDFQPLFDEAEWLLNNTTISTRDGDDVFVTEYWTTPAQRSTFEALLSEARRIRALHPHGWTAIRNPSPERDTFSRGDIIDMTFQIERNAGFSSMFLYLQMPPELELIGLENHTDSDLSFGSYGWDYEDDENLWVDGVMNFANTPITDTVIAGWWFVSTADDTDTITGDGELVTFKFRVTADATAGVTAPITVAFRNANEFEEPRSFRDARNILLPGTPTIAEPRVFTIGGITIAYEQ